MKLRLEKAQIEEIKDGLGFDRRLVEFYFSAEFLSDDEVVEELIAVVRAEVDPKLIRTIQNGKAPHELLVGAAGTGGLLLNPREDFFSLFGELWTACLGALSIKMDKRELRKAVRQGKRTVIAAVQKSRLGPKISKDRRKVSRKDPSRE
jgi:hypothetical protein